MIVTPLCQYTKEKISWLSNLFCKMQKSLTGLLIYKNCELPAQNSFRLLLLDCIVNVRDKKSVIILNAKKCGKVSEKFIVNVLRKIVCDVLQINIDIISWKTIM